MNKLLHTAEILTFGLGFILAAVIGYVAINTHYEHGGAVPMCYDANSQADFGVPPCTALIKQYNIK